MDKSKIMALLNEPMDGLKIKVTSTSSPSYAVNASGNLSVGAITDLSSGSGTADFSSTAGITNAVYTYPKSTLTAWDYWQNDYYPSIIRESYPVYIRERSMDKGQKAFELLKVLQDKELIKFDKVKDFIEAMDAVIKVI